MMLDAKKHKYIRWNFVAIVYTSGDIRYSITTTTYHYHYHFGLQTAIFDCSLTLIHANVKISLVVLLDIDIIGKAVGILLLSCIY